MKKTRAITAIAAGVATSGLLAGVALAWTTSSADTDDVRISTLAQTTTAVGEAKGDVISAAARDADDRMTVSEDEDRDADDRAKAEDKDRDADDHAKHADRDGHGDAVSAAAHNKTTKGEAHGDAVSSVARSH